jgi:hypothetical protein
VFHYSLENKAELMTWKHLGSPAKKKFKTTRRLGKVVATVFWDKHGVILVDFSLHSMTISVSRYQGTVTGFKEAVCYKRPGLLSLGVLLLHSNARPHIADITVNLLNAWHWEILLRSPCGPDLAPWGFHLFPTFEVYASKLMKTSKRRSSNGCICRLHHFTTKALTF